MAAKSKAKLQTTKLSPYELVFKATNDVLYDLDVLSGAVTWNEALYNQYGYQPADGQNTLEWWTHHIHPDDALKVENQITDWLEGQKDSWESEYRFAKANGHYTYVRDRGYVMRAADGTPQRLIGSLLDITSQRQLDRAKDEFISLVSHQLRTPLTVIRTYGDMLHNDFFGQLSDIQKDEVKRMTDASIRLIKLVSSILDVSKIELQRVAVTPHLSDINSLIQQQISGIIPIADNKSVHITFVPQPELEPVSVDPTIFGQILHNYLTNAIRYSRSNGGLVTINFTIDESGYLLTVADNGIGIPRSAQNRVFERFYRAHNASNIEDQGTGLGLYLVKLLAEACGGTVGFESIKSKVTTFHFRLPVGGMAAN